MSIINATLAGGTRRMLQDVLAWHNAKSHDIGRVNSMAASGLIPKDDQGNLKIPPDVLDGLWRPFPGSTPSTVNITNFASDAPAPQPQASQPAAAPVPPASTQAATGAPGVSWAKVAAIAAALASGVGGIGGLGYWLGLPAAVAPSVQQPPAAASPNYTVPLTQYELRIGKRSPTTTTQASE